jgi:hypothetical protein
MCSRNDKAKKHVRQEERNWRSFGSSSIGRRKEIFLEEDALRRAIKRLCL